MIASHSFFKMEVCVKSFSSTSLFTCALLMTMGSFAGARAAVLSRETASAGVLQQEAQETNASESIAGNWQVSWAAMNGNSRQVSMQVKQDGSKLSGTFEGERGSAPLKGTLKGNQVSFTVKLPRRQLSFSGTVEGGKMSGTTEQGASWSATRQ
jgi:hypothetical protein